MIDEAAGFVSQLRRCDTKLWLRHAFSANREADLAQSSRHGLSLRITAQSIAPSCALNMHSLTPVISASSATTARIDA